jgi:dipeptidase E
MAVTRTIVAVGGKQLDHLELTRFILDLTGASRPRVLFLPTASGDSPDYVNRFYQAFGRANCSPDHLPLFVRPDDVATPIAEADAIIVGGGNTKNLLLIWREHGIDSAIRAAYERGTVLSGWSAGCICWFEDGITDSYGPTLRPMGDGLAWIKGSACPHYDGEVTRRPTYVNGIREGRIAAGYAADDAVGLVFRDESFVEAVSPRRDGRAFFVDASREESLPVRTIP